MALEVGEEILDDERAAMRNPLRIRIAVGDRVEQRHRGRVEPVEDAALGIVSGVEIGDAAVVRDAEVLHVASRATYCAHERKAFVGARGRLAGAGLEVVEKIHLGVVEQRRIELVGDAVVIGVVGPHRRSAGA